GPGHFRVAEGSALEEAPRVRHETPDDVFGLAARSGSRPGGGGPAVAGQAEQMSNRDRLVRLTFRLIRRHQDQNHAPTGLLLTALRVRETCRMPGPDLGVPALRFGSQIRPPVRAAVVGRPGRTVPTGGRRRSLPV